MFRNHRKHDIVPSSLLFWTSLLIFFCFVCFSAFFFVSIFHLFYADLVAEKFHPELGMTCMDTVNRAVSDEAITTTTTTTTTATASSAIYIRETVTFPDEILIFLYRPQSVPSFTKDDLHCAYSSDDSSRPELKEPPSQVEHYLDEQIVRCPLPPRGYTISLISKSTVYTLPGPTNRWDSTVYEALIDRDNTTVVFVKGLNLRSEKLSTSSRFECVYGWDVVNPKLRSKVLLIAQEIVRCETPPSILNGSDLVNENPIKVSVRVKGGVTLPSIARPVHHQTTQSTVRKQHDMCVCTMVRNVANTLREWVMYHDKIGVQRWFIYDNNSDDDINIVVDELNNHYYNITRHIWPWVKTQEAGFAHCAIRAQEVCDWVGFIDVDEFLHMPSNLMLHDVIKNHTSNVNDNIGQLRTPCYSFGPSGLKTIPSGGVTVGYTCRLATQERHKSIVKPEALNSTLINVIHHFHLKNDFVSVDVNRELMVINHYKYQVWDVFKEKFYRRVSTYVADWQDEQNVGAKDRTPGLGTKPVEPLDWSSRFCEVNDTDLRDRVLDMFMDSSSQRLPWQQENDEQIDYSPDEIRKEAEL